MAVQPSVKDSFTFVGGLNTEGGYFITPENSWKDGVNIIPTLDGSIERRTGIDYEDSYQLYAANLLAVDKQQHAYATGLWTTVAGNGDLNFFVAQVGPTIYFYDAASGSVSNNKQSFSVTLTSVIDNTEIIGSAICSFASTYGKLIVTSKNTYPIIITYTPNVNPALEGTITHKNIDIEIRDFKGNITGQPVDVEYTQAEWEALGINFSYVLYNLYNQGWTDTQIATYKTANADKYPSNTKSWIFGKDTNDVFVADLLNKQDFGNSPAAKGRYIIAPFFNRETVTSIYYRPSICSFFAGRAWFSDVEDTGSIGIIYFSQVLDDIDKVGKCYQQNDPTSEVLSDIQDSDGGVISIPDAGAIVALHPVGRGIMVFSSNGVWFISGIDRGFTASSYSVERISSVGCNNPKSIVDVEGTLAYWSSNGIYTLAQGRTGAEYTSANVSDKNIASFYGDIPILSRFYAEGSYNGFDKTIYWLYSSAENGINNENRFDKDSVLALDLRLNSWYWFSFDTTVGSIPVSIEATRETNQVSTSYTVAAGVDTVNAGTDTVGVNINVTTSTQKVFKFLTLHKVNSNNYSVTFSDLNNTRDTTTSFKDWYSANAVGVEKTSYVLTGYNMGGNGPARVKTGQYLTVFLKRTETAFDANTIPLNPSSCLMQARWDFTDNGYAGKWADEVQVYRQLRPFFAQPSTAFDDSYPLVITKNKLRGRGKAAQFKYTSEAGKDMKIVGWTVTYVGGTNV